MDLLDVGDSWAVGLVEVGRTMVVVRANVEVAEAAPFERHPVRVRIRIRLNHPTGEGMPTRAEAAELRSIEDRLEGSLGSPPRGRLCASVTSPDGHRDLLFHVEEGDGARQWAEQAPSGSPSHLLQVEVADDPDWSIVRWLGERTALADGDRQVIASLQEQGIDTSVPRTMEHLLDFPDEAAARAAADALIDHEYDVTVQVAGDRWCVVARHEQTPTPAIIAALRADLTAFCEDRGGAFDGWGVPVDPARKRRRRSR